MPFLNRALLQYASVDLEAGHSKEVVNIRMGQRRAKRHDDALNFTDMQSSVVGSACFTWNAPNYSDGCFADKLRGGGSSP